MSYTQIKNPSTNRMVSIYSKLGKSIIESYISKLDGGASTTPNITTPNITTPDIVLRRQNAFDEFEPLDDDYSEVLRELFKDDSENMTEQGHLIFEHVVRAITPNNAADQEPEINNLEAAAITNFIREESQNENNMDAMIAAMNEETRTDAGKIRFKNAAMKIIIERRFVNLLRENVDLRRQEAAAAAAAAAASREEDRAEMEEHQRAEMEEHQRAEMEEHQRAKMEEHKRAGKIIHEKTVKRLSLEKGYMKTLDSLKKRYEALQDHMVHLKNDNEFQYYAQVQTKLQATITSKDIYNFLNELNQYINGRRNYFVIKGWAVKEMGYGYFIEETLKELKKNNYSVLYDMKKYLLELENKIQFILEKRKSEDLLIKYYNDKNIQDILDDQFPVITEYEEAGKEKVALPRDYSLEQKKSYKLEFDKKMSILNNLLTKCNDHVKGTYLPWKRAFKDISPETKEKIEYDLLNGEKMSYFIDISTKLDNMITESENRNRGLQTVKDNKIALIEEITALRDILKNNEQIDLSKYFTECKSVNQHKPYTKAVADHQELVGNLRDTEGKMDKQYKKQICDIIDEVLHDKGGCKFNNTTGNCAKKK